MNLNENNEEALLEDLEIDLASLEVNQGQDEAESDLETDLRKVFVAALGGQADILYSILKLQNPTKQEYLLNQPYQDVKGQNCPLLVIAARNGHDKVVKTLISKVFYFCFVYHFSRFVL